MSDREGCPFRHRFLGTAATQVFPMSNAAPPEQGQFVHVQQRRWIVNDVAKNTSPINLPRPYWGDQHLGTLFSSDDDD
jgi:hypothetical protein